MIQINLFTKQTHRLSELMVIWGEGRGEGLVKEFRMDRYTLLYFKWISNKVILLYRTRNSAQCYVTAWVWGDLGGKLIYIYAKSLCFPPETITILLISYTPIQNEKLKTKTEHSLMQNKCFKTNARWWRHTKSSGNKHTGFDNLFFFFLISFTTLLWYRHWN